MPSKNLEECEALRARIAAFLHKFEDPHGYHGETVDGWNPANQVIGILIYHLSQYL